MTITSNSRSSTLEVNQVRRRGSLKAWRNRSADSYCSPRPSLLDPNFRRSVVLVGAHSEAGAMGIVLNRPSDGDRRRGGARSSSRPPASSRPVYVGGPVQPNAIVFLAEFLDPSPAGLLVLGRIGFPAPEADIDELSDAIARRRVFAGYAGWGEGQLDEELDNGDWIAHPAEPDDVFTEDPEELWAQGARPQGRRLRADGADAAGPADELRLSARAAVCAALASFGARPRDAVPRPRASARGFHAAAARRRAFTLYGSSARSAGLCRPVPRYPTPRSPMLKLARWSTTHRRLVVIGWIVLIVARGRPRVIGGDGILQQLHAAQLRRPARLGPAASRASRRRPGTATRSSSASHDGTVLDPAVRAHMSAMFAEVAKLPHVSDGDQPLRGTVGGQGDLRQPPDRVRDGGVRRESQPAARERRRTRRQSRSGRAAAGPAGGARAGRRSRPPSRQASASRPRSG